jgi:hypothetical protein
MTINSQFKLWIKLGSASGKLDIDSIWMQQAAEKDPEIADFVRRARDFWGTWFEEVKDRGPDLFPKGCGWPSQ